MSRPRQRTVLVLGSTVTALSTLRALRPLQKLGWEVVLGGVSTRKNIAWRSRIPNRKFLFREGLIEGLRRLGPTFSGRACLLFTQDDEVVQVSRHREELEPYYAFHLPEDPWVRTLMEKGAFARFALEAGLTVPLTLDVPDRMALLALPDRLAFPIILKPYLRHAERADTMADLERLAEDFEPVHYESMVAQEFIPGGDDTLYFVFLLLDASGRIVHRMVGRKLRQWPVSYGTTSLAVSIENQRLLREVDRFVEACPLKGYASIEFKYDRPRDRYVIMEPTIGRFNQQVALSVSSGVNFPVAMVSLLAGEKVRLTPQQNGKFWIYESNDWFAYRHNGSDYGYLSNFLQPGSGVLTSLSDPLPLVYECLNLGRKRIRKIIRHA